jgi:hypothetical protein
MPGQIEDSSTEHWMNSKWRPAMGWMYMLVCTCDFIIFPVLWSMLQGIFHGQVTSQWQPLTLQGAGLFHLSMGAIMGIAAWGRTQEKVSGTSVTNIPNVPLTTPATPVYTNGVPSSTGMPANLNPINNPTSTKSAGPNFGSQPAL